MRSLPLCALLIACGAPVDRPAAPLVPVGRFELELDPANGVARFSRAQALVTELPFGEDGSPSTNPPGTIQAVTASVRLPGQAGCGALQNCFTVRLTNFTGLEQRGVYMAIDSIVSPIGRSLDAPDPAPAGVSAAFGGRSFGDLAAGASSAELALDFTVPDGSPYRVAGTFWGDPAPLPSHEYPFDGDLDDTFGGPSLVSLGGALSGGRYVFGANQGLRLSGALGSVSDYTVEMIFRFDTVAGYARLLETKNRLSDAGLYCRDGAINFVPVFEGPAGAIVAGRDAHLVITRTAARITTVYVDRAQQLSVFDSDFTLPNGPDGVLHFFADDTAVVPNEANPGSVDLIRVYEGALTPAQVATLF